jgi:hypothetical protein
LQFNKDLLYGFGDGAAWKRFLTVLCEAADIARLDSGLLSQLLQSAHRRIDTAVEDTADATNAATAYALANSLKAKFNTHAAATAFHFAADSTNEVEADDADSVAELVLLANEIKADFNAHLSDTGHLVSDPKNEIKAANAGGEDNDAKTASAIVLLNEAKAKYNAHLANAWPM